MTVSLRHAYHPCPPCSVGRRPKPPPTTAVTESRRPLLRVGYRADEPGEARCPNHEGTAIVGCRPFNVGVILVRVGLCVRQEDSDATVPMLHSRPGGFALQSSEPVQARRSVRISRRDARSDEGSAPYSQQKRAQEGSRVGIRWWEVERGMDDARLCSK